MEQGKRYRTAGPWKVDSSKAPHKCTAENSRDCSFRIRYDDEEVPQEVFSQDGGGVMCTGTEHRNCVSKTPRYKDAKNNTFLYNDNVDDGKRKHMEYILRHENMDCKIAYRAGEETSKIWSCTKCEHKRDHDNKEDPNFDTHVNIHIKNDEAYDVDRKRDHNDIFYFYHAQKPKPGASYDKNEQYTVRMNKSSGDDNDSNDDGDDDDIIKYTAFQLLVGANEDESLNVTISGKTEPIKIDSNNKKNHEYLLEMIVQGADNIHEGSF